MKKAKAKRQFLRNAIECQFVFCCIGKAFLESTKSNRAVTIFPGCSNHSQTLCSPNSNKCLSMMKLWKYEQIHWIKSPFFRYDKLFVDNKLYVWSEVQGRVVEQVSTFYVFEFLKMSALKYLHFGQLTKNKKSGKTCCSRLPESLMAPPLALAPGRPPSWQTMDSTGWTKKSIYIEVKPRTSLLQHSGLHRWWETVASKGKPWLQLRCVGLPQLFDEHRNQLLKSLPV